MIKTKKHIARGLKFTFVSELLTFFINFKNVIAAFPLGINVDPLPVVSVLIPLIILYHSYFHVVMTNGTFSHEIHVLDQQL